MGAGDKRERREGNGWPIAISLVLCALFAIAIIFKAKSDYTNQKAALFDNVSNSAKLIGADIDAKYLSLKSSLVAISQVSALNGAAFAAANPEFEIVAVYNSDGSLNSATSENANEVNALAAAAQLADEKGWLGAIAQNSAKIRPTIAVRDSQNMVLVATLKINSENLLGRSQSLIITDNVGAIIYAANGLKLQGVKSIKQGFAINNLPQNNIPWAQFAKSMNGEDYILGANATQSGFMVFISEPKAFANNEILKTLLFYALLFMGPVLAFFGIWFIVKDQTQKFEISQFHMREAERRLRIAIEGAKCGVWDWNLADDNVFLTSRLAQSLNLGEGGRFSTEELMNGIIEEDRLRLRAALRASMQIGAVDITIRVKSQNPKEKPIFLQFRGRAALQKDEPNFIRIIGVSIDVSEQMQTEQRVAAAERRLKDAINSFTGPFALWSKEGALLMWNDAFGRVFGLDAATMHPGAKYENVAKASSVAVASRRADRSDAQAQEIELQNGDWIRLIERRTSDGGMVSIGIDISTQKQSEAEVLQSEKQLRNVVEALKSSENEAAELAKRYEREKIRAEHASKSKDVFLANMSHELRTPLNAIIGFSDMMMREMYGVLGNPNYKEYARDINQSGIHLLELINGVLDMAKIDAGKFKIYPQNMSIDEAIDQSIRIVRGKAEEKSIILEKDIDENDEIHADARAIRQILINLLSNAIKFTENKGRVLIRTRRNAENITISVIDNGIGIAENDLPRLAKPFEQVENEHSRTNQGTGLGLALVNSFAHLHGGKMQITSKTGVGTKVDIILPVNAIIHEEAA